MRRPFDLQGHRGARGLFPENTLEGFRAAWALGVTAFELDVGLTRDGVVVVHHDLALNPDIARTSGGAWILPPGELIQAMTLAELQVYDVGRLRPGSRTAKVFPQQQPCDLARIPTLESVLVALPDARFTIEIKTDPRRPHDTAPASAIAEAVLAVVDAAGAGSRIAIESFDWRGPRHIRRLRPGVSLAWLTRRETIRHAALWWDGVDLRAHGGSIPRAVAAEGGQIWAPDHRLLSHREIDHAHRLGLTVLPWTVNHPGDMQRLYDWGADGLISDRPDLFPVTPHQGK